jgi:diguanylate cyclase (GGDEF)-like protein
MKSRTGYLNILLISLMGALCVVSISMSFWAVRSAEQLHAELTHDQIYELKKSFLRDTVQNMFRDIDRLRESYRSHAREEIDLLSGSLELFARSNPDDIRKRTLSLLEERSSTEHLYIHFRDTSTGSVLFTEGSSTPAQKADGKKLVLGKYELLLGVDESWVDAATKANITDIIHSQTFEHNGYIWVNEVINWDGGDRYAIRRIHPNLIDTEGSYLSTKTTDDWGNTPYLRELEGIKKDGELFSRYYFKRKGSDEVSEKMSYAALYPDYCWIVAMGMHIEDIDLYIEAISESSKKLNARIIALVIVFLSMFFTLGLVLLMVTGRRVMDREGEAIRKESNTDPLTGTLNRRIGDRYFSLIFRGFKRSQVNPVLLYIDLDNFKKINDTYGHDAGDLVLKAVVSQVRQTMRATDYLFRWGGEEFVLVYNGVKHEDALMLSGRLNSQVAHAPIAIGPTDAASGETRVITITISIGISWFALTDASPEEALRRADRALYRAKVEGKNCARVEAPE